MQIEIGDRMLTAMQWPRRCDPPEPVPVYITRPAATPGSTAYPSTRRVRPEPCAHALLDDAPSLIALRRLNAIGGRRDARDPPSISFRLVIARCSAHKSSVKTGQTVMKRVDESETWAGVSQVP